MSYIKAERTAVKMLAAGYVHDSYESELKSKEYFSMDRESFVGFLESNDFKKEMFKYTKALAPTEFRGLKNTIISLISLSCRTAIALGVDNNFSYALSDHYIYELELKKNKEEAFEFTKSILLHYYDLVQRASKKSYSKPVRNAVKYIESNLYEKITPAEVSLKVGLEPHYFSTLFKKETGTTLGRYIRSIKLEESKRLFEMADNTVTEVSEYLCFCDVAHFSHCFKKQFGVSPKEYLSFCRPTADSIE